ncbi:MAG: hypothetical protein JW703_00760 [Candidatus Diapherotrites archaeon]|nr:hypothetical protein [Candidatus Diapherotrites archaeon]
MKQKRVEENEWKILFTLMNKSINQKKLALITGISESTLSRTIKQLNNMIKTKNNFQNEIIIKLKRDLNPFLKIIQFIFINYGKQEIEAMFNSKFFKECLKDKQIQDFIFIICSPAREICKEIKTEKPPILVYLENQDNEIFHIFGNFFNKNEKKRIIEILSKSPSAFELIFLKQDEFNELQETLFANEYSDMLGSECIHSEKEFNYLKKICEKLVKQKEFPKLSETEIISLVERFSERKKVLLDYLQKIYDLDAIKYPKLFKATL